MDFTLVQQLREDVFKKPTRSDLTQRAKDVPEDLRTEINYKKLLAAHCIAGRKQFGKLWDSANIGWSASDDSIMSKVYGKGGGYFHSSIDPDDGQIYHS